MRRRKGVPCPLSPNRGPVPLSILLLPSSSSWAIHAQFSVWLVEHFSFMGEMWSVLWTCCVAFQVLVLQDRSSTCMLHVRSGKRPLAKLIAPKEEFYGECVGLRGGNTIFTPQMTAPFPVTSRIENHMVGCMHRLTTGWAAKLICIRGLRMALVS